MNNKHIDDFLDYLDGLEKVYVTEENKNDKSRRLLLASVNQIKNKIDVLAKTLSYIESDVDFEKDNYVRLGDLISNINEIGGEKHFAFLQFSTREKFMFGNLISFRTKDGFPFLSIPNEVADISLGKRLKEVELREKRYSWALNHPIVTDKNMVSHFTIRTSYLSEFENLVVNTKWISCLDINETVSKAVYKCVVDDREKCIDRKQEFISQYKVDTKSPTVSISLGDLMQEYEKEMKKVYGNDITSIKKEGSADFGVIDWCCNFPYSKGELGDFYLTCRNNGHFSARHKNEESIFFRFAFDFDKKGSAKKVFRHHGVGLNDLTSGDNAELVLEINLQDKYLIKENNKPLRDAISNCIENGKVLDVKNYYDEFGC